MSPTLLDRLKSLPLTIVLTVLIWMYAEAKFTATQDNVHLTLKPLSPTPDLALRAFDPGDNRFQPTVNIVATLEGPKNQIDRIYQESIGAVPQGDEFATLAFIPATVDLKMGSDNRFDTVSVLNSLRYFRTRGVTITSATPARIRLEVDHLESFSKPVEFHSPLPVDHLSISPDQVIVSAPATALQTIGGAQRLRVTATPQREVSSLAPGVSQSLPVRFSAEYPGPHDERITITPPMGTVTLTIPRREAISQVVPDVPVWVSGPPALLARYNVDVRPKFLRVTVSGTEPAVRALQERMATGTRGTGGGDQGIRAYLDLTLDDQPSDTLTRRRVRYVLPEGLMVQDQPPEVEFRLIDTGTPATTQPPTTQPTTTAK